MLRGLGVDIVGNKRFEGLSDHVIQRIMSQTEWNEASALQGRRRCEFLASRFAAKEAFAKALGTGFVGFAPHEVSLEEDASGLPRLVFSERVEALVGRSLVHVSIAHEHDYSVAVVVLDGEK